MRADEGALVALDAVISIPDRDTVGNSSLLFESDVLLHGAIFEFPLTESRDRKIVAIESADNRNIVIPIVITGRFDRRIDRKIRPSRIDRDLT